jgi:predicted DCC family thiol-disulfide oxidoreductase YuxK
MLTQLPSEISLENSNEIVLFDGVCNFCNRSVQFVIRKEKKPELKFASLQSETGKRLLKKCNVEQGNDGSIVYLHNGKAYTKTSAVLRLTTKFKGIWPIFSFFLIFPPFLRDWVYVIIAKNRYKWWGKTESCQIPPSPELRQRFIDL